MPQFLQIWLHRSRHYPVDVLRVGPKLRDHPKKVAQALAFAGDCVRQFRVRLQQLGDGGPHGRIGDLAGEDAVPNVCAELLPDKLEGSEGLDNAVCEGGRDALNLLVREKSAQEMAVERLLVRTTENYFGGAGGLRLDIFHGAPELLAPEDVRGGGGGHDAARRLKLFAAVDKLQGFSVAERERPRKTQR